MHLRREPLPSSPFPNHFLRPPVESWFVVSISVFKPKKVKMLISGLKIKHTRRETAEYFVVWALFMLLCSDMWWQWLVV